jgi:RNA polymerase sigma-70 factor (ECF subfamily)
MCSDGDLLLRWIAGDAAAGDELSRRYYWSVHRFFELKAPYLAEDLTQQTFLACVQARDRYLQLGSFRAFLFGIARRQLLRHLRSRHTQERLMDFGDHDAPGSGPTPSGLVAGHEEQRLLLRAISQLPIYLQMTLQLHYWEGLKSHEIGGALGIPTSTVTSRLALARAYIRKQVGTHPRQRARESLLSDLDGWAASLSGRPLPKMFADASRVPSRGRR